jgi:hypothetical protein
LMNVSSGKYFPVSNPAVIESPIMRTVRRVIIFLRHGFPSFRFQSISYYFLYHPAKKD